MNPLGNLIAAAILGVLPLVAGAQISTPADQSSSGKGLTLDQPRSESQSPQERRATEENVRIPISAQTGSSATETTTQSDPSRLKAKANRQDKVIRNNQRAERAKADAVPSGD